MSGGIIGGLARSMFQQESFFLQTVRAGPGCAGEALFAAAEVGGIAVIDVGRSSMMISQGAFLAADESVEMATSWNNSVSSAAFSGTGITVMLASGSGAVAIAGYGGLMRYNLPAGQVMWVDNGHLVAWSKSMKHEVGLASQGNGGFLGRVITSATSGEGLMCHFEGPGEIYIQSHKPGMPTAGDTGHRNRQQQVHPAAAAFSCCIAAVMLCFFVLVIGIFVYAAVTGQLEPSQRLSRQLDASWGRDEY